MSVAAECRCVLGKTCDCVMKHHRVIASTSVAHAEFAAAGSVAAREGRGYYDKKCVQSHRREGRQIAACGGGWWRLWLNWRRVVAVRLRGGSTRCSRLSVVGRLHPSIATELDASGS